MSQTTPTTAKVADPVAGPTTATAPPVPAVPSPQQMDIEEPATVDATAPERAERYVKENAGLVCQVILAVICSIFVLVFVDVMIIGTDDEYLRNGIKSCFECAKWIGKWGAWAFFAPVFALLVIANKKGEFKEGDKAKTDSSAVTGDATTTTTTTAAAASQGKQKQNKPTSFSDMAGMCAGTAAACGLTWLLNFLLLLWWNARYGN